MVVSRQANPVDIDASFMYTPKVPTQTTAIVRFMRCRPGRARSVDHVRLADLELPIGHQRSYEL